MNEEIQQDALNDLTDNIPCRSKNNTDTQDPCCMLFKKLFSPKHREGIMTIMKYSLDMFQSLSMQPEMPMPNQTIKSETDDILMRRKYVKHFMTIVIN